MGPRQREPATLSPHRPAPLRPKRDQRSDTRYRLSIRWQSRHARRDRLRKGLRAATSLLQEQPRAAPDQFPPLLRQRMQGKPGPGPLAVAPAADSCGLIALLDETLSVASEVTDFAPALDAVVGKRQWREDHRARQHSPHGRPASPTDRHSPVSATPEPTACPTQNRGRRRGVEPIRSVPREAGVHEAMPTARRKTRARCRSARGPFVVPVRARKPRGG